MSRSLLERANGLGRSEELDQRLWIKKKGWRTVKSTDGRLEGQGGGKGVTLEVRGFS